MMLDDDQEMMLHLRAIQQCLQLIDLDLYHDLHDRLNELSIDDPLLQALTILELATQTDELSQACLVVDNSDLERTQVRVDDRWWF